MAEAPSNRCLLSDRSRVREENRTNTGQKLFVHQIQSTRHGIVTNNLTVKGGQHDTSVRISGQIPVTILIHDNLGLQRDAGFPLHDLHVFLDGYVEDLFDRADILVAAENGDFHFFNLDESLDNEFLEQLGVVLTARYDGTLGAGIGHELLQQIVANLHFFDAAFANLGRSRDTLLHFAILFLLGEFVLNVQLGFVHQSLLLQIEIVFRLETKVQVKKGVGVRKRYMYILWI
jgi:hypothetical protein